MNLKKELRIREACLNRRRLTSKPHFGSKEFVREEVVRKYKYYKSKARLKNPPKNARIKGRTLLRKALEKLETKEVPVVKTKNVIARKRNLDIVPELFPELRDC